MFQELTFSQFRKRFPNDDACLEEIKRVRYAKGIICSKCKQATKHYRIKERPAYACMICRNQTFPLAHTIFEKSSTSLRLWFYAMFLLTHTRGALSAKQMQHELGVTYKTAWRMNKRIKKLMRRNNEDLLTAASEEGDENERINKVRKWVFFKHFEIAVVEKEKEEPA